MIKKYLQDPFLWLFTFVGLCIVITPVILFQEVGMPFGGFVTGLSCQQKFWMVSTSTPPWWSDLFQQKFLQGFFNKSDSLTSSVAILKINGQEFGPNSIAILQSLVANKSPSVEMEIGRGSEVAFINVPIIILTYSHFLDMALPNFLNSFCYWIVGLGVYLLRPKDQTNRVFALTCCVIAASQSLNRPAILPYHNYYAWTVRALWALIAPFSGITILHFATLFPIYQSTPRIKKLLFAVYLQAGFVGIAFALSHYLFLRNGFSDLAAFLDRLGSISTFVILLIGWGTFFLNNLVVHRMSVKQKKNQAQTKIILGGTLLAGLYIIPLSLQFLFNHLFPLDIDTRYFLLAIPIAFAFISLRYKSFRSSRPPLWLLIPFIISISALFASIFSWAWWKFVPGITRPPFEQSLLTSLILMSSWNILTSARGFLFRILNWETINYSMVHQFGQQLLGTTDINSLSQNMSRLLQDMLSLEKVAIWFWDEETTQFESATTLTESTSLPFAIHLPTGLNLTYSQPHRLGEEKNHVSIWLKTFINVQEWSVAIPLGIDRPNGLILLGPRTDDEIFDERDFTILTLMARQATLFVFAAQVTYWLDKAQEDERFRIAQDLHDTIQQSLNAVSIHLHMIQKMVHYDVEHSALFALECQTDIKDAIRNLYEIRRSLDPSELAHGLIGPIKLAAERAKRVRGLDTHIVASPEVDDQLSPTARRAMYRMVKQALDNTLNHANASNFNIQLAFENKKVFFSIVDDGQGSTTEQRELAMTSGHMGLKTMRTRIESLGGQFSYNSQPGVGTQITGWIPVT